VFWHQGENNSGADSPTGDWDYKSYQQYFMDMSAAWKQDYPNIQHYLVYQVWPKPCLMGPKGDQLREAQRTLPRLYSNMSILSTIGVTESWNTYGLCHFDAAGYQQIADLTARLLARDFYSATPANAVTAPNLQRAYYTNGSRNQLALEFDQSMWSGSFNAATVNFYLDKVAGKVTSGSVAGNVVTLQLSAASTATTIDYVEDNYWNGNAANLVYGTNSIAALTFADVIIGPPAATALTATAGDGQVVLDWTAPAGATGYTVKRSLTAGGPYATIGSAGGNGYTDTTVTNGIKYYYVVAATNTVGTSVGEGPNSNEANVTPLSAYSAWAAAPAQGLTAGGNDGPLADPDHDGIPNLLEFALRGAPMVASRSILPTLTKTGGQWLFEYDRSDAALPPATIQVVEYGSDLTGWTAVTIPATSAGSVTITPGSPSDHVSVAIPDLGGKLFVRLRVSQ